MIDRAGRAESRFPAAKEAAAARALDDILRRLDASASSVAICGGACGGDLLFAEAAARLGCAIWLYLPFAREAFIEASVDIGAGDWRPRFEAMERVAERERIGDASPDDPMAFAANNARMLEAARSIQRSTSPLDLVCIWDGRVGDGPGGTGDMIQKAIMTGARVSRIDPRTLD